MNLSSGDPALDAVIDYQVSLFDRTEIAGAYRSLCAMLLLRTASILMKPIRERNIEAQQKKAAKEWLAEGRIGVITFDEACYAIDVDPASMRSQILERVQRRQSVMKKRPYPSYVFGRSASNDFNEHEPHAEVAAAG